MAKDLYDLIIIGSGPAGYVAAHRAGELGLSVAVVEKSPNLGGTCLNVGCIPSKALLASTEHFHFASKHFADHGIEIDAPKVNVGKLMERKDRVVDGLRKGIQFLFKKAKVDHIQGFGKLIDSSTVEVCDADEKRSQYKATNILLATGSSPVQLPFLKFDGKKVVSSDQAIAFEEVPKSLLVIGAGAIGLELGSVWARLGTDVTVVEFLPRVAAGFDTEVSKTLQKTFEKQGLKFHLETKVQSADVTNSGVTVTALKGEEKLTFEAEKVLVSVGRRPFTEGLGLEEAGVKLTDRGRVEVDANWKTSLPNVYAIGDIIEGPMLAHKAESEGAAFAERLSGKAAPVNYDAVPNVVYTSPEAASVGLTEDEAKERELGVKVGKYNFIANGRAKAADATDGFVKIIADAKTDKLLGAHIIASNASELIHEVCVCMEFGGSAEDLCRTMHAHPTMSEVIREAAHAAYAG